MQQGYRPYPQQMPPQRAPPNARRGGPGGPIMAPVGGVVAAPPPGMHAMAPHPQQVLPPHLQQQIPPHLQQHPHAVAPMPMPPQQQQQHPGMAHHGVAPMGHPGGGHHPGAVHHPPPHMAAHHPPHPQAHHPHHPQAAQAAVAQQQQAAAAQQQAAHHAIEAAKRRSRKPTDKTMPDGVEDVVVVGDGVARYRELRDFERRLDATMTRKRLDIVDSVHRNMQKRYKTLRIWVSNTVENQPWQGPSASNNGTNVDSFDFTTGTEASYRVKIEGRLLDEDDDDAEVEAGKEAKEAKTADGDAMETDGPKKDGDAAAPAQPKYHFTQFFRSMSVEYITKKTAGAKNGAADAVIANAAAAADGTATGPKPVEWKRPDRPPNAPQPGLPPPPAVPEFDELTFKRPGDEDAHVVINLFRLEDPERFELDDALADIVDLKEATRAEAVMGLFEYIRLQGLQEDEEKRNFRCDDLLRKLINNDIGYIPMLHEYVNTHIRPLPPVQLPYTIRVDQGFHTNSPQPTVYDVRVAIDDPLRTQLRPFVQSPAYAHLLRDVASLDEQLAILIQAISLSKSKHEFLTALAKDPAQFVRQWLSSQKRDLDIIMGESARSVGGGAALSSASSGFHSGGAAAGYSLAAGAGGDDAAWRANGQSAIWTSQNARESVNLLLAKQPLIPRGQ